MADQSKVSESNLRQFAGLKNGYAEEMAPTVGNDLGKAELAQLTSQKGGWEFADDNKSSGGWEFADDSHNTSLMDDFKIGMAQVGNMFDKGLTLAQKGAESIFNARATRKDTDKPSQAVPVQMTDPDLFKYMDQREEQRNQWANPDKKQQTFGGQLSSAALTLPMQVIGAPLSAIDTGVEFIRKGESLEKAYAASGIEAAFTAAGLKIPAAVGKTLLTKALVGGGSNAVLDTVGRMAVSQVADNKETKDHFAPTASTAGVAGIIGAGFGALHGTGKKADVAPAPDSAAKIAGTEPAVTPENTSIDPAMRAAEVENTKYQVEKLYKELEGKEGPLYDRQREELQRLHEKAQAELATIMSDHRAMEDSQTGQMDLLSYDANSIPYKLSLEENSQHWDNGVRHLDPDTGKVVQGMDASVPTVEAQLKLEALSKDSNIQQMREQIAAHEAQLAHLRERGAMPTQIAALGRTINDAYSKLSDYLDKGYGITSKDDVYGKVYEGGTGETKLPIQKTYTAKSGKFGRQGGAINPKEIREGIGSLMDRLRQKNESSRIMGEEAVVRSGKHAVDPTSERNVALKDGSAVRLKTELFGEWGTVTAVDKSGREVGTLTFRTTEPNGVRTNPTVDVHPEMQRKGLATAMYDQAHAVGAKIPDANAPGVVRTPEGTAFRNAYAKKNQGGAIDPQAIREGINILKEKFKKKGIPEHVAKAAAEEGMQPKKPEPVLNPAIVALQKSAAGKGIADFSALDKSPAEIIEMSKQVPDIKRAPLQEQIENGGLFRQIATRNPIVMHTVERFKQADQTARRLISEHLTSPQTGLVGKLRSINPKEKAELWGRMMMEEGKRDLSEADLRESGFNDKQIEAYKKFREVDNMVFDRMNKARAEQGLAPMDKRLGHIAGRFLGDFRAAAWRPKLDKAGNPVFEADGTIAKEFIGFVGGKTRWEVQDAVKKMTEKNPDWKFEDIQYKKIGKGGNAEARFGGLMEVLNQISKDSQHMGEFLDAYKDLLKSDAQKWLNATRHAEPKKANPGGVHGSEGNKPWQDLVKNADEGFKANLDYMEQAMQWIEMQDAAKKVREVTTDPSIVDHAPNAVGWSNMYQDHLFGRNAGWVADAANGLIDAIGEKTGIGRTIPLNVTKKVKHLMMQKFMGFWNIPFSITQLVQPLQTIPPMAALLKSRGIDFMASKAAMDGTWSAMKMMYQETPIPGLVHMNKMKLDAFEKAAYDYAHDAGVFDMKLADHTKDIHESKFMENFNKYVADANITWPEMATRSTAFMFFAHALKDTGMSHPEIFKTAENLTNVTMADYTPGARPIGYDHMGWAGDLASTLTRYKHNQVSQLNLYARELKDTGHYAPLATYMGTMVGFGGIVGMLGYNTAEWLYQELMGLAGHPDSLTDAIMRSNVPQALTHGIISLSGVDMSSRFSQSKLLPESPSEFLMPFWSGVKDVAQSSWDLATHPNKWNAKRFAKSVAPSSMTGLIENQLFSEQREDGKYHVLNSRSGDRSGEGMYDRTEEQRTLRNFGFRSMEESNAQNKLYQQRLIGTAESDKRKGIVNDAFSDALSGKADTQTLAKYAQAYVAANGDPNNFANEFSQKMQAKELTAEQRWVLRNAGNNITAAIRMQRYMNPNYNKKW